jgi:hypothetical protein
VSISRAEYESSIYCKLRGTEFESWAEISSTVHCFKVKKSPFNKLKYKVITDSPVIYFVNFPPKNWRRSVLYYRERKNCEITIYLFK